MAKYKVKIFSRARNDLEEIIEYLNSLSPQAAADYFDKLTERIASLDEMPERCPLVRDHILQAKGYRSLIYRNYIIFFVISGDIVQIRRIIFGRRNYQWLV